MRAANAGSHWPSNAQAGISSVQKNKPGTYSVRDSYLVVNQQEVDESNFDLLKTIFSG
jgi:hypothetical protein